MPARRRAEKFNAWVEGNAPDALNDARILEVVAALRASEAPALRADFAADLRSRLMAEADTVLVRTERKLTVPGSLAPTQRRHHRRLAVAASALAVVGATTSVSMAAQNALPGDALYPIKRALENAQTDLASGDAKTQEMLSHAASRLSEATELATLDTPESNAAVADTLDDFSAQANEAAEQALASNDPAQITQLREFAAESMQELELLDSVVPDELRDAVAEAAHLLTDIDQRALAACPSCGGAVIDLPPIFLASASGTKNGAAVVAPNAQQGTSDSAVTLPGVDVTDVIDPSQSGGSSGSSGTSSDGGDDASLIPPDDQTSSDPVSALGQLLDGNSKDANTSNPLEPITSPLVEAVDETVNGALDTLTPDQ